MKRYFGKHRAVVVDNDDPERRGRVKVSLPWLQGGAATTGWAMPCVPYAGPDQGIVSPPPGTPVWIEFEEGDLDRPIWVGVWQAN